MKAFPESEWKRLGIGYGPVSGQVFPEACAFELSDIGPQGEPLFRYSEDQPRDPDGKFGSSTVGGAVSINDKEFEHQQVLSSHMQEALKNGSVESYSAFKAASDSMKNNMAATGLTDRAKDDAINNLKEHVKAAEEDGDKKAAAAFKAGIESLSLRFSDDQPRGADGKFTMGNVATFKNEADGISAHVTSFNGKYHVHLMDDDSGNVLPQSSIHSGDGAKEKAIAHAKKLVDAE
jgi:hypothetical protein